MKQFRIAVIGAGRWGPNLLRNFHTNPGSKVLAVADRDPQRLKLIAERFPDVATFEDENRAISFPEVDAVVICTPTVTHYELVKKALDSGKHVFVEKPFAETSAQCRELMALAKKKNLEIFVGHVFVYNAGIQAVKKELDSGSLGRIYYVHSTRTNLGPVRGDVNAFWDLASHDVSVLRYWFGKKPVEVSATGGRFLNQKIEDVVFATMNFADGVVANIHASWLDPQKVRQMVVVGEKKMLIWDDMDLQNPIKIFDKRVVVDRAQDTVVDSFMSFRTSIVEGETIIPKLQLNEPLKAECEAFLAALRDPRTSLSTAEDGLAVVEVLEATDRSLKEAGRKVSV